MAKIVLDRPGIPPIVRQLVAARVTQHMAADLEREARRLSSPRDHAPVTGHAQGCQALGGEHVEPRLPLRAPPRHPAGSSFSFGRSFELHSRNLIAPESTSLHAHGARTTRGAALERAARCGGRPHPALRCARRPGRSRLDPRRQPAVAVSRVSPADGLDVGAGAVSHPKCKPSPSSVMHSAPGVCLHPVKPDGLVVEAARLDDSSAAGCSGQTAHSSNAQSAAANCAMSGAMARIRRSTTSRNVARRCAVCPCGCQVSIGHGKSGHDDAELDLADERFEVLDGAAFIGARAVGLALLLDLDLALSVAVAMLRLAWVRRPAP